MTADDLVGNTMSPKYASTGIDSGAAGVDADAAELDSGAAGVDADDLEPEPDPKALTVEQQFGLALLRLRVYRGLSQAKLERLSAVDQTMISRLETGKSRGTSNRRVFAILEALRAEEITFGPGPRKVPQSSWEDAMYGDLWERAGRVAAARLSRRRSA